MRRPLVALLMLLTSACAPAPAPAADQPPDGGSRSNAPMSSATPDGPDLAGIEGLQAYGPEHPDEFGGLYIDPPGSQRVVMLFTANLEEHARAADAIHPGTTVRRVEHTEAELVTILEGIDHEALQADGIETLSAGLDTINNRIFLEAKSNDPTAELRLELAFGGLVEVTIHALPGEWQNVAEGDGWRLVGFGVVVNTEAYTVRAARDGAEWEEMWRQIGLEGSAPSVDFADEVVVSFGHGIGSTCTEIRLDDVVVDGDLVHSVTSDPLAPRACTADLAGAAVFVVAVARDALADDGFTLRLGAERTTCPDCGFSEEVEVSLP